MPTETTILFLAKKENKFSLFYLSFSTKKDIILVLEIFYYVVSVGTKRAEVECVEESGTPVDDKYCKAMPRPDDRQRTCNENPCPPT